MKIFRGATAKDEIVGVGVVKIDHQRAHGNLLDGRTRDAIPTPSTAPATPASVPESRTKTAIEAVVLLFVVHTTDGGNHEVASRRHHLQTVPLQVGRDIFPDSLLIQRVIGLDLGKREGVVVLKLRVVVIVRADRLCVQRGRQADGC